MLELDIQWSVEGFELAATLDSTAERCGVFGPSGGGKTSLLRIVAGLEDQARGRVAFRDRVWQTAEGTFVDPWERDIAWSPQDALVFPHLEAEANLRYADPANEAFDRVVDALEIGDRLDASASALSGGEAQRVALGRALLADPDLLLLDEPFSALDSRLTDRVSEFLDDWCTDRGASLFVAAHSAPAIESLIDERFRIRDGQLVEPA